MSIYRTIGIILRYDMIHTIRMLYLRFMSTSNTYTLMIQNFLHTIRHINKYRVSYRYIQLWAHLVLFGTETTNMFVIKEN